MTIEIGQIYEIKKGISSCSAVNSSTTHIRIDSLNNGSLNYTTLNSEGKEQSACHSCLKEADLVPMSETDMVNLTPIQEAKLDPEAKALVKIGVLDSALNVANTTKLMSMLLEINFKAVAGLAQKEIDAEEARLKKV